MNATLTRAAIIKADAQHDETLGFYHSARDLWLEAACAYGAQGKEGERTICLRAASECEAKAAPVPKIRLVAVDGERIGA